MTKPGKRSCSKSAKATVGIALISNVRSAICAGTIALMTEYLCAATGIYSIAAFQAGSEIDVLK